MILLEQVPSLRGDDDLATWMARGDRERYWIGHLDARNSLGGYNLAWKPFACVFCSALPGVNDWHASGEEWCCIACGDGESVHGRNCADLTVGH